MADIGKGNGRFKYLVVNKTVKTVKQNPTK
jgi:hypothetical protein